MTPNKSERLLKDIAEHPVYGTRYPNGLPKREKDPFYGMRYSVPVLAWDSDGELLPWFVMWDSYSQGWVTGDLCNGPSSANYLLDVACWANIPNKPEEATK